MKAKIDVKTAEADPVTYNKMLKNAGSYKIVTLANDVFAISFGDEQNALYVSDGEVEMLSRIAWKDDKFIPLSDDITIVFPGAA